MNTRLVFRHGVALVLLTLGGCSIGDDPQQWVAQEKAKRGAPLQPLPTIKTFETFLYKDQDLRDPFGPGLEELTVNTGPHPDQNRSPEPLEAFPLDGLKMSGTLGLANKIEGLIRDPDGVVHRVPVETLDDIPRLQTGSGCRRSGLDLIDDRLRRGINQNLPHALAPPSTGRRDVRHDRDRKPLTVPVDTTSPAL